MTRNPDILFVTEYLQNVLYFATVRQGKVLKSTADTHYFCVDNELVYENYYSDFGPLNLGCVYKYCRALNEKLKQYLNKQAIVHYTCIDPKKKANAAFLLGCYGVLYLSFTPREALKPLLIQGQSYRPFQDAVQGDSEHTISLLDCLQAIKRARELGFFNFQDFNYEEYDRLDKIQGGDLNWIVPEKFLAFIGPVDYSVSLYHPPDMYIDYFLDNNVKIVVRLNKRYYDGDVFTNAGISHYDLYFTDGSCPPRNILFKFMQISEEADCAIAVHCKAGLGRTGSLIGCYLIKHYRMTAREAIGWMRICRPGSVIGHQQVLMTLISDISKVCDRKRMYQDQSKVPTHEFGVYSIAEKTLKQRPGLYNRTSSPPPAMQRLTRSDISPPIRPHTSRTKQDGSDEAEEIFITAIDLTYPTQVQMTQLKGCVIRNNLISEEHSRSDSYLKQSKTSFWKRLICCRPCIDCCKDSLWGLAVRCAKIAPKTCSTNSLCLFLDRAAEKETSEWHMRVPKTNNITRLNYKGEKDSSSPPRRGSGGGEPRVLAQSKTGPGLMKPQQRNSAKSNDSTAKNIAAYTNPIPTFRTSQGPVIKTINDARNFLMRSTISRDDRDRHHNSTVKVTPHFSRGSQYAGHPTVENVAHITPSTFTPASRTTTQPQYRRRLGRSPSPPQFRAEQSRATNTNTPTCAGKFLAKDASKTTLKEVLSRLKLVTGRNGSVGAASLGAASLGARRDAPESKRAPSVRSDERPTATQGDMLNCIKFQRRLRDSLHSDRLTGLVQEKLGVTAKEKKSGATTGNKCSLPLNNSSSKEVPGTTSKGFFGPPRPSSPKGRRYSNATTYN